jgi:hypothetical protein
MYRHISAHKWTDPADLKGLADLAWYDKLPTTRAINVEPEQRMDAFKAFSSMALRCPAMFL